MAKFKTDYQAGQGKISASDLNARGRALDAMVGNLPRGSFIGPDGEIYQRPQGVADNKPILAKVTGVAALGAKTSQFVYTITQVKLTVTASGGTPSAVTIEEVEQGKGIIDGKALNIAELANSDTGVAFGVDQGGTDYPAGFTVKPISGGGDDATHQQDVLVYVVGKVAASDGSTIYLIDRMGTHDGGCSA